VGGSATFAGSKVAGRYTNPPFTRTNSHLGGPATLTALSLDREVRPAGTAPSVRLQFGRIARRSLVCTLRQPTLVIPSFLFPLFMLAVVSAGGDDVTKVKGFPTDSYITFILAASLVQGVSGIATMAGTTLGNDISSGFVNRLVLTPIRASTLVIANLAGVSVLGLAQAAIYLGVGLAASAHVKAGFAGGFAIVGVTFLIGLAFGAIGLFAAVAGGSSAQMQGIVAVVLALLFMSSMLMPRNLIDKHWFKEIATYNPLSYLVEANRSLLISGWDKQALALGCGIAGGLLVLFLMGAVALLRRRMA
jgi:ABC-2 type transport system permease protein